MSRMDGETFGAPLFHMIYAIFAQFGLQEKISQPVQILRVSTHLSPILSSPLFCPALGSTPIQISTVNRPFWEHSTSEAMM